MGLDIIDVKLSKVLIERELYLLHGSDVVDSFLKNKVILKTPDSAEVLFEKLSILSKELFKFRVAFVLFQQDTVSYQYNLYFEADLDLFSFLEHIKIK